MEQPVRLFSTVNIASEEDHARGLQTTEQGTKAGRHLSAVEAHDEQLADLSGN
jgi:hypothetical protein